MTTDLRFEFSWLDNADPDPVEAATSASLAIHLDGEIVTEVEDRHAKTVLTSIRVSLYPLALWLAANWWRLRWEPKVEGLSWRMAHNVAAAGGGDLWPDLSFFSDGERMWAEVRSTPSRAKQSLRYLNELSLPISADGYEHAVQDLIETVIERLDALGVEEDQLRTLWDEIKLETNTPEYAKWRRLEARLGFDPDEAPVELIQELLDLEKSVGHEAVEEVACASKEAALEHLQKLWKVREQATKLGLDKGVLEELPRGLGGRKSPPWKRGEVLARKFRDALSWKEGPVYNKTLSELLNFREEYLDGPADMEKSVPMSAGYRINDGSDFRAVLRSAHPNARRFAVARLIAEIVAAPETDRLFPLTSARTWRQSFQRAFAHELLCPFDDLQSFLIDRYGGVESLGDDEIEEAAEHFHVSPLLIRSKLVNKRLLDRAALDDEEPDVSYDSQLSGSFGHPG